MSVNERHCQIGKLAIHRGIWRFVAHEGSGIERLPTIAAMKHPTPQARRLSLRHRAALAIALTLLLTATAQAQRIDVQPGTDVLAGQALQIVLSGMPPHSEVSLQATRRVVEFTGGQRTYSAQARFKADAQGWVDLSTQAPLSGSYRSADVRGLFWSMLPNKDAAQPASQATSQPTPQPTSQPTAPPLHTVLLQARTADGMLLAEQAVQLRRSSPAVQQRNAEPFAGAVFATPPATLPGPQKRPTLILLGGSEGGSAITRDAPVWASRGFAVLALPYYSAPGFGANGPTPAELPTLPAAFADIPIDRLQQAHDWLAQQPEVDASRIGVMGTSKGAEFALLAGVRMPWIKAIVAIVPSDVVWEGWGPGVAPGQRSSFSWQGKPLAFVPYQDFDKEFANFATGADVLIRRPQDQGRAANPGRVAAARIAVEDIAAPVLVAGADDDQIWDSGGMARAIADARNKAGRSTALLVYREAGHYLGGTGWSPTTQYNASPMKSGGTPEATARAQAEVFTRTHEFLLRNLGAAAAP